MSSPATKVFTRTILLGALAAALAVVESYVPKPVPWARLGLGHAGVLLALWIDGAGAALGVLALKLLLSGLVGGGLVNPVALTGATAGCAAWAAMALVHHLVPERLLGPVGVSAAGALAYGVVQVEVIGLWLVKSPLWDIAPAVIVPGGPGRSHYRLHGGTRHQAARAAPGQRRGCSNSVPRRPTESRGVGTCSPDSARDSGSSVRPRAPGAECGA